jgi:serpin B
MKSTTLTLSTLLVLLSTLLLSGSSPVNPPGESLGPGELVKGNNRFCIDLYRQVAGKDGNVFFSPYSISTAVAMTYGGAAGMTRKEMAQVMHFTLPPEDLHPAFRKLSVHMQAIQDRGHIRLSIANALWIQKNFQLKKKFLEITETFYGAAPFPVDYIPANERETSRQRINNWVEDKTKKKIKNLIPRGILNAATRLVLTNAIYFKGNWFTRFETSRTKDAPFWISPAKSVNVPMMNQTNTFGYKADQNVQVLEMPYKGKEISMVMLLPNKGYGIRELEQDLKRRLGDWTSSLRQTEVIVFFPKFKITCNYQLKETLEAMGMRTAFVKSADFSAMAEEKLKITEVLHKAFVEVNEEGTEAAAATAMIVGKIESAAPPTPVFRADHPFIFLIKDSTTGSILFIGRLSDPY